MRKSQPWLYNALSNDGCGDAADMLARVVAPTRVINNRMEVKVLVRTGNHSSCSITLLF